MENGCETFGIQHETTHQCEKAVDDTLDNVDEKNGFSLGCETMQMEWKQKEQKSLGFVVHLIAMAALFNCFRDGTRNMTC